MKFSDTDLRASGRGLHDPYTTVVAYPTGVEVRTDDTENLEYHHTLYLSREALVELLRRCDQDPDHADEDEADLLDLDAAIELAE